MAFHEEYYTCDKCGKKLKRYSAWTTEFTEHCTIPCMNKNDLSYIQNQIDEIRRQDDENLETNVHFAYRFMLGTKSESFDLCKECAKQTKELIKNFLNGDEEFIGKYGKNKKR